MSCHDNDYEWQWLLVSVQRIRVMWKRSPRHRFNSQLTLFTWASAVRRDARFCYVALPLSINRLLSMKFVNDQSDFLNGCRYTPLEIRLQYDASLVSTQHLFSYAFFLWILVVFGGVDMSIVFQHYVHRSFYHYDISKKYNFAWWKG